MDEIRVPLNDFDLAGFIGRIVSFIGQLGTGNPAPLTSIPVVEAGVLTPNLYENAVDRVPHDEMVKENKTLYFPFSSSNNRDPVLCADGREYIVPDSETVKNTQYTGFTLDTTETVGFMVRVCDNQVGIQFAKHFMGNAEVPALIKPLKHTGEFEDGMKAFLETFIAG